MYMFSWVPLPLYTLYHHPAKRFSRDLLFMGDINLFYWTAFYSFLFSLPILYTYIRMCECIVASNGKKNGFQENQYF